MKNTKAYLGQIKTLTSNRIKLSHAWLLCEANPNDHLLISFMLCLFPSNKNTKKDKWNKSELWGLFLPFGECLGDENRKDQSCLWIDFWELGIESEFSPGESLGNFCSWVTSVFVNSGVDKDSIVSSIPPNMSIENVMLGNTTSQYNNTWLLWFHGQLVDFSSISDNIAS